MNKGYLCLKQKEGSNPLIESEQRLHFPLKRTKAGWTRLSWDEALDFAAESLTEIREKNGAESLVRYSGTPVTYEARDGFLQFMGVYGSPNFTGASNLCHVPRHLAFVSAFGGTRSGFSFDIKNYFSSDFGCNATDFRASLSAMASHVVKGLALFRDKESEKPYRSGFYESLSKWCDLLSP